MIKRPSPLVQMTLALVGLCGMLVILADLFFGVLPDRDAEAMRWRKSVSESVAVQVAALLQSNEPKLLQRTLEGVAARTDGLRSVAIRRADGSLVAQAGDHGRHWRPLSGDMSIPEQVTVPLNASGARWGSFELAFAGREGHAVFEFLRQPLVITLGFISFAGTLAFGLYMRRALQHLDPSSVIPERVQGAFDAMAEGVVVMDARARVLLANKAFRGLHEQARTLGVGHSLSSLPWLGEGLPKDVEAHPWSRAIAQRSAISGVTFEVGRGSDDARQLVVNSSPITDAGGAVRGCLVTFDDVSELHRTNERLRETIDALDAARQEVQRQNAELERLATRDPLSGCLNRRAFHAALETALAEARRTQQPLSCVMIDIDHFKVVNDSHGHLIGDRVIQEVAKKLLECARATDLVCRYGGEEFCLILRGMPQGVAEEFAERVRGRIERECGAAVREVQGLRITGSVGLAVLARGTSTPVELIDQADKAMYRAKRGGRNQVCVYQPVHAGAADAGITDPISGCLTLPNFQLAFEALLRDASARGWILSGIKFAIDPYRALHAAGGQAAADQAMREVAQVLIAAARPTDLLVRLDAEHLGVVAPGLSIDEAVVWAEAVRARVQSDAAAPADGTPNALRLTVSAGVDALPARAPAIATLIERAGKALLRAKRQGPNLVNRFTTTAAAKTAVDQEPLAAAESLDS